MLMETVVKKFGNSLGVSLPASLREGRNIDVGSHVDIVESDSDLVITVRGNKKKVPSLKEMLAQCDLSAERHPDLVAFESAPAVGQETL
jgi:antitoxin component of MazEF toxin-antitoxin module